MAFSKSIAAYGDCKDFCDQALDSEKGIHLELETKGQVTRMIQKLNTYRVLLRNRSMDVYPKDHSEYGLSIYEDLEFTRDPTNELGLYIRPRRTAKVNKVTVL